MRHHWLIIVPKTKSAWRELPPLISNDVIPRLIWKPEHNIAAKVGDFAIGLSFSSNSRLFGYEQPCLHMDDRFCAVSGLPTLEDYGLPPKANVPHEISDILRAKSADDIFNHAGGTWSIGHIDSSQVTAFSDFCGYHSCFYTETKKWLAISNKAALLAPLTSEKKWFKPSKAYNYEALSWLFSTTMVQGHETAFNNVHKLKPGHVLTYSQALGLEIKAMSPNFHTPLDLKGEAERDCYLKTRVEQLAERTAWYIGRGIELHSHLTGGKDSRTILSLLMGSGRIEAVERLSTTGTEDNGDVIVARLIAQQLGLTEKHCVNAGNKSRVTRSFDDVMAGFIHCGFKYDGQLSPFDGRAVPSGHHPAKAAFMGGGGEIYRQKSYQNHQNISDIYKQFKDWSYPYNALNLLTLQERQRQSHKIQQRAKNLRGDNILNHQAKYYIDHRLSTWGQGHFQASSGNTLPLLLDIGITRLMFHAQDMGENIHFDIIRHSCPELLKIPFHNARWLGVTRARAAEYDCDIEPIQVPVAKSFPWQFEFYENFRDSCVDYCLDNFPQDYAPYVSREALEAIKSEPMSFGSAKIKMLYGLVMAFQSFHEGARPIAMPDLVAATELEFSGNFITPDFQSAVKTIKEDTKAKEELLQKMRTYQP